MLKICQIWERVDGISAENYKRKFDFQFYKWLCAWSIDDRKYKQFELIYNNEIKNLHELLHGIAPKSQIKQQ